MAAGVVAPTEAPNPNPPPVEGDTSSPAEELAAVAPKPNPEEAGGGEAPKPNPDAVSFVSFSFVGDPAAVAPKPNPDEGAVSFVSLVGDPASALAVVGVAPKLNPVRAGDGDPNTGAGTGLIDALGEGEDTNP